MTVVASDDLTAYADLDALVAGGWGYENVDTAHRNLDYSVGASGATVGVPTGTPMWTGRGFYHRTFTGLTPGAAYTVTAVVDSCTLDGTGYEVGLVGSTYGTVGQQLAYLDHTDQANVTLTTAPVTAHTDGSLYVQIGFHYGFGSWPHDYREVTFSSVSIEDGTPAPVFHTALPVLGIDWDTIAYTAGVMYIGSEMVGLTRGALRFDPGEKWAPLPFPGDFVAPVGTYELTEQRPRFIGSFLPVGPRRLALYLPASTQSTDFDTTTVTPAVPGTTLTQGDYTQDLKVTWPLFDGGTITVTFPYAFWQRYEFQPENKGELLVPCEILGVPLTATTAPYLISVVEPSS